MKQGVSLFVSSMLSSGSESVSISFRLLFAAAQLEFEFKISSCISVLCLLERAFCFLF